MSQTALAQTPSVFTGSHWSEFGGGAKAVCNDNDIDNDDDGLIELCYLGDLDAMRYQLDGTGLKRSADGSKSTTGCPSSGCKGYELVRDLDFNDDDSYRDTANKARWTSGDGWVPIGYSTISFIGSGEATIPNPFRSIFEGNGHTLANLRIDRLGRNDVGLFGYIGPPSIINGIYLVNVDVRGVGNIGGLVGHNTQGKVLNSCSSGQASGKDAVGGLVGLQAVPVGNRPIIVNSYSRAQVSGDTRAGGLIGHSDTSEIINSYSSGQASGNEQVGGLVGQSNDRSIVGSNDTGFFYSMQNCYSSAQVAGKDAVGGLVGNNTSNAFFINSYSSGQISSTGNNVGGLVGFYQGRGRTTFNLVINSSTKTTAQLQAPTGPTGIYSTWSSVAWDFGTSTEYPAVKYTTFSGVTYLTCGTSQQPPCGRLLPGQGRIWVVISTETSVRTRAYEGDAVVLDATRGGNITYQWSQIGSDSLGLTTVNAATLRFVIPSDLIGGNAKEQTLTLQLKVGGDINSATTISIVVKKIDNGPMAPLTITRINTRRITLQAGLDPDGVGTSPAYLWQKCPNADCDPWQPVSGDATSTSYSIPKNDAIVGNQFRVQLAYRDGQNYQTTVTSAPYAYTNQKPTVKSTDNQVIVTIGTTLNKQILAGVFEDADGDVLSYTATELPSDSHLMLSSDGRLRTLDSNKVDGTATTNTATIFVVTADDGVSTTTATFKLFFNAVPEITDIEPIATTEGEVVTIVAEVKDANFDSLSYLWSVTAGDRTASLLANSTVTSTTLVFTIPTDWADTAQTMLSLLVSVGDGVTTSTKPVIVNITRTDNGEWTTKPTISERDRRLTISAISAALATDPDGADTIQMYQWQKCLADADCSPKGQWQSIRGATNDSYQIQEAEAVKDNQFRVQFTYRDGQNYQTTSTSEPLVYVALRIIDIDPIATTEGEVVTIVARANVSSGNLSYVWHTTTEDKVLSLLAGSTLTSATLVFTIPTNWADTDQTMLSLLVSVSDGETTGTNLAIVNITRIDNGGLATTPTIIERDRRLTVRTNLNSDPDGSGTIHAYQWQICSGSSCSWQSAAGTSTASSYTIQEEDAVQGNQFRVQLSYSDGQGYSRTVISEVLNYGEAKAVFMRLKLFLEGALQ